MKKLFLLAATIIISMNLCGQTLVGTGQTYSTLKSAFDAINNGILTGAVVLQLTSSTTETATAVLNPSGGTASYTSVTIYPTGAGYTISGTIAGALIHLDGADNVILDGRVNQTGNRNLTIINDNTGATASTILFSNDATSNVVKYCSVAGSGTTNGVITFGTTNGSTGNNNNTIEQCEVKDGTTRPRYLIYSSGTVAKENSNNSILSCNLMNFNGTSTTGAIWLAENNSLWTMTGNSIYQATAYAGSASTAYGIYINGGNGYQISGNFIGGNAPSCGGTPWSINGTAAAFKFTGIHLGVGTTTATSVQGNAIKNIYWLTSATATSSPGVWNGIYIASGNVNTGNVTGNVVGDSVGTGSITIVTTATLNAYCYGITSVSTGTATNISNNRVGSMTLGNGTATTALSALYCIHNSGGTASTVTVMQNNLVGSLTTPNSILYANPTTSTVNQFINGLYNNALGTATISGNTIANIKNNYPASGSNASSIFGIFIGGGSNTITDNVVRDLTSMGTSTGTGISTNIGGIFVRDIAAVTGNQIISGNTLYNFFNTATSAAVTINGIYYNGPANSSSNVIEKNHIYNLNPSTTGIANISGIFVSSASTSTRVSNNMVSLGAGLSGNYIINGIMDNAGTNNYYFNSVYIGGASVTGTSATHAFQSAVTNNTRSFLNNIFYNARSNGTGTGKHYAVRVAGTIVNPVGLTINYNDYYTSGTGGILGYFNGTDRTTLAAWQTAVGQDANSIFSDPQFVSTTDLHIQTTATSPVSNAGIPVTMVPDDFDGDLRTNTPDIGADEFSGIPVSNCTGTPTSSLILGPDSLCAGGSATLSLNTSYNLLGITFQWKYATSATGPWMNLDTNAVQPTGALATTRYFTCSISCSFSSQTFTTPVKSIIVTPQPNAVISYPGSPYCQSDSNNISVTFTGTTGGTFSSAPSGLAIVAGTGSVYPPSSQAGNYTVTYYIPAAGGCQAYIANTTIAISAVPSATINYAGSPYCTSLSSIQAVTLNGTGGGIFTAAPAGLIINASTGGVTPGASTPGSYTVTYSMSGTGTCPPAFTTAQVTITEMPSATIAYSSTLYCTNITTPQIPVITGSTGGSFTSTPGLSIDPSTGTITPSTSSMGVYSVAYFIPAAGGCPNFATSTSVIINPMPEPAGLITSFNHDTVNTGTMNASYSVSPINFATSYVWQYTGTGVTFNPDSVTFSNSVQLNFPFNATSGILTVRGHNSCGYGTASAGYPVHVIVGLDEPEQATRFSLSPNPTDGVIHIHLDQLQTDADIRLFSSDGRILQSLRWSEDHPSIMMIDLSSYAKGVYYLNVSGSGFSKTERVILR